MNKINGVPATNVMHIVMWVKEELNVNETYFWRCVVVEREIFFGERERESDLPVETP